MKRFLSDQGFSLIQVLLLSGALSATALVAIQTFRQQSQDLKEADVKDKVEQVHNMVYSILQNRNHCLKTIADSTPGGLNLTPNSSRNLTAISLAGSTDKAFEVGTGKRYLTGSVSIDRMELALPPDLKDLATLTIDYGRHGNKRDTTDTIRRTIKLSLSRSSPILLSSCTSITATNGDIGELGNENLSRSMCESMALMVWDPDLKKCTLKSTNLCPPQTIFAGLDADGNKICENLIKYVPYLVDTSFKQSCPDDYNLVKLNQTFTSPRKISVECNKKDSTCPSKHKMDWTFNGLTCDAYLPRGTDGMVYTARDLSTTDLNATSTGTATGSIVYDCDKGNWIPRDPTKVCEAPCLATTATWGNCTANLSFKQHNETEYITDTAGSSTGYATYKCDRRGWYRVSSYCTSPCAPATVQWGPSGARCQVTTTAEILDGDSVTMTDSILDPTGTATIKCVAGTLTVQSGATCTTPPKPGKCTWDRVIEWENPGCSGFQVKDTPYTTIHNVTSSAVCMAYCGGCESPTGKKSNDGCKFTPD